jgi:xanthine dehydrogenase accessory factor
MSGIYRELLRMSAAGEPGALVVVTGVKGHAPQVVGAKMIVRMDGTVVGTIGGGRVEQAVTERALEIARSGQPQSLSYQLKAELGMCCGGLMEVYVEPLETRQRLILFGAGHVAMPTARLAHQVGFEVVVVDERPDWNSAERFPDAAERAVEPHRDFLARVELGATDHVVITTPSHDFDRELLGLTVQTGAGYVGMIGSTRKVEKARMTLLAEGVPQHALDRAHTPVGLDILAETPEEIAVSIVGELIRHRRQQTSRKKTRGAAVASLAHAQTEEP